MRSTLSISIVIHVLVITLSIFGLPFLYKSPAKQQKPMVVEVVSIGNKTELPKPAKKDTSKQVKEKKENIIFLSLIASAILITGVIASL